MTSGDLFGATTRRRRRVAPGRRRGQGARVRVTSARRDASTDATPGGRRISAVTRGEHNGDSSDDDDDDDDDGDDGCEAEEA